MPEVLLWSDAKLGISAGALSLKVAVLRLPEMVFIKQVSLVMYPKS